MFRPQPISSTDARKYFTKIINKVQFSSKSFVIKSYRQPIVRVVNENYIRALEEVIGKNAVNQVMQIAGNDRLFEAEKIEQIKKVFQRRLSGSPTGRQGSPHPQPKPQPQQILPKRDKYERDRHARPKSSQPQPRQKPTPPQPKQVPKPRSEAQTKKNPAPHPSLPTSNRSRRPLLLQNGKNYPEARIITQP